MKGIHLEPGGLGLASDFATDFLYDSDTLPVLSGPQLPQQPNEENDQDNSTGLLWKLKERKHSVNSGECQC